MQKNSQYCFMWISINKMFYSCHHCEKQFSSTSQRDTHSRTHTGEKPYSCSLCQKTFSQNNNLKKHLKIHFGEKPYHCNQCPNAFSQNVYLKIHLRIHSGKNYILAINVLRPSLKVVI